MIGYEEITAIAPEATNESRDQFFADNDISGDDLVKIGHELALHRLQTLEEGEVVSAQEIITLAISMMLFGFEIAWKLRSAQE